MKLPVLLFLALLAPTLLATEIREFSADYDIFYGDIHLGSANYRFTRSGEDRYRFDFSSRLDFLIFWDERVVWSDLVHDKRRLLPTHYRHDRKGTGRDYLEELVFDRAAGRIVATYGKEKKELDYEEGIIDGLTMQLQLMLDLQQGVERPSYRIVDFNRLKEYAFSHEGMETITIEGVEHESIVLQVVRDNERRTTKMWYSPERDYLPLQMVHFSKGKKRFNAHLVAYEELD